MAFLAPALAKLRDEIDARAPHRSTVSDGWIGDPAHASRHSDHNPEPDGSVDAIDITHDPAHGVDCALLADEIKDDPRLQGGGYIIWNWRIWNPDIARIWRPYSGTNGHTKHMHVSVSDAGQNNTSPWLEGDELMGVGDDILAKVREIDRKVPGVKQQERDRATLKATARIVRDIANGRPVDDRVLSRLDALLTEDDE